ncbi:hypothetical protein FD00_GL002292 [Liquorilactobacillus mali KCTC 3596 = DSM 20444]|uniref:Uncharacterized protein n=1 Tax=Liquorilactobacillus mali KCTC 3596 = DSM 20444 TaxID=1046596 RepID=A0A0R2E3Y1_9LACO|nr:hypothetical protein FD00_GL002292 [Liquorilactobacillus mali KCTC 3596 = DSM 20444]
MNKVYKFLYRRRLLILLSFFTIIRIVISLKIPLFAQGNAVADDYLYTIYAKDLLAGHWLGSFNSLTLVKSISFSFFLVINYILGIPYRLALILFYLVSLITLCYSLYKVSKSKAFSYLLFNFFTILTDNAPSRKCSKNISGWRIGKCHHSCNWFIYRVVC